MQTAEQTEVNWRFNPFTQSYYQNPYALLHRLRREDPVHWSFFGMWLLTRYDDTVELLRDRDHFSADHVTQWDGYAAYRKQAQTESAYVRTEKGILAFTEGSEHARLRAAIKPTFAQSLFHRLRPIVDDAAAGLIGAAMRHPSQPLDIIADLAQPLATRMLREVLGIAPGEEQALHRWAVAYNMAIEPLAGTEVLRAADAATIEMRAVFDARRDEVPDDGNLTSTLAQAIREGAVTEDEAFALWASIVLAGSATTINLIGNGLYALLQHREQFVRLCDDSGLLKNGINELLRFDSPGMVVTRAAVADVELGGKTIRKGQMVMAFLGAANRDPEVFAEPDVLAVDRPNANQHLAFGQGVHFCIGEQIARIQIESVLRMLIAKCPDVRLASEHVQWFAKVHWRGLRSLPVLL
ncbi:cytochrome P450 [Trinickia sp. LjRoot230]|uniref:cytochrome P450 n=1 Tax=Trinickia sp. LjRoot230 TaxID=3342288 RepID=UPI003ECF9F40